MKSDIDLLELRSAANKVATSEIRKYQNEAYHGTLPRALFNSFAASGFSGISISEERGGLDLPAIGSAVIFEEIAKIDLGPAIFLSVHSMVSGMLGRFGSNALQTKYLNKCADGSILAAFALTEPEAGSDAKALRTNFKISADKFILNGDKCYISSAGYADIYLVFARSCDDGAVSAFIVESNDPGLTISPAEKKMGCELSPIASLNFNELTLGADRLVGEIGQGYKIALSGLAGGRVNIAACANGISSAAIDAALKHLKQRQQFGQKLIEFQALQFMLADMRIKYEASLALVTAAAQAIDSKAAQSEVRTKSSIAKCFATDSAMQITTDAVQLLGGAGYIKEYHVERYMRDAKMLQIVEGTNQIQRVLIAREMI